MPTCSPGREPSSAADLSICVVTVEEIERGLGRLPAGRRWHDLEQRWQQLMDVSPT